MITTEEIQRLMRIVPDDIRSLWEIRNYNSNSLVKAQQAREAAIKEKDRLSTNMIRLLIGTLTFVAALLAVGIFMKTPYLHFVFVILAGIAATIIVVYGNLTTNKEDLLAAKILVYDGTFEEFQRDVNSLNPWGTGNPDQDLYDRRLICDKAVDAAQRVIDAQQKFDALRKSHRASRSDIICVGQWLEKCEKSFDKLWIACVVSFGLQMERVDIFEEAGNQLAKSKPQ